MKRSKRVNMKSAFVGMPKSFYNVLTFRKLKIGDKFISLPVPGDNHGHGGFRNNHYVFKKIAARERNNFPEISDNAFRLKDGNISSFSDYMPVIRLED